MRSTKPDADGAWMQRLRGAIALVAPATCADCGGRLAPNDSAPRILGDHLCTACEGALQLEPTGPSRAPIAHAPWPVRAALLYASDGERWVHRIKYPARGLAGLDADARGVLHALARHVARDMPSPDLIVPVPLHGSAYLRREQNPALLWARALGRSLGAPVRPRLLAKRHPTRPQKGLGVAERRSNVAGAFFAPTALLEDAEVLVVDDVVTTGATVEACVRALHAAGLRRRGHVACLARTPARAELEGTEQRR